MSAESATQIWKESLLDQKLFFCKLDINNKILFGLIELSDTFGNGSLVIPVKGNSLANFNKSKLSSDAPFKVYKSIGLNMENMYGEIECTAYLSTSSDLFRLILKRTISKTKENLIAQHEAEKSNDPILMSLVSFLKGFKKSLPGTTLQPVLAIEYPESTYNGEVLRK